MAKRNLELKTSPRPKDRPAGLGMSLEDDAFNQRARAASEESANVEFRASLQPQMSYNPLARLGYDPNKAKVVDYETDNAFYWSPYNSQEDVDEFFTGAEEPPKNYKKGDVAPDDVVAFSSSESPLTSAFPSIWSHEFTHRGVGQVIEYMREDPKDFTKKYGKAATDRLIRIDEGSSSELNENLTELFDDLSAVEKIGGELVDHEAKLDNGNYAGSIEEFQKEIAKKKPEDRWDHNTSKYADVVGIMTAAQDLLTAKGEPPVAEQKQKGFFGKIKEALGFAEGGSVMRTDNQMKLYALGGMEDDGMEVDPVSGNEIPPGSMAREVRDDIPAQLSDGEYVVPADVVRFFGVKYFEDLRQEAKIGLQRMEQDGRIGGEPVEMAQGLTEGDMAALQEMTRTGVASGGLMDKIAYTAMNDPVVNERLNSYGVPVKFAVGGMAQSQYNNPTEIDQIIQQVGATLQQRPEIMQELAKRGITISRTEADVPAQQMATANSPSQTTEPIMAATGTLVNSPYINPISAATTSTPNTNTNQYSLLPPGFDTFNTLGGSYFTPESYNAPNVSQPVAAPAPVEPVAPITCPPGYLWDAASGTCLPVQNDGGGNDDLEQTKAVSKPWYEGEDFSDPTKYVNSLLTDVTGLGKIAQIAGVFNPAALLVGGVGIGSKVVQNVAKARAMAQVQAALGNTELAKTLTDSIDGYIGKQSGFVKGLEGMGFGSGVNYANSFAKILGFKDLKDAQGTSVRSEIGIDGKPLNKKSNLERFQFQYKDYVTRQAEDNKADKLTTEEIRSVTNQSNRDNDNGVYSPGGVDVASVRDGGSNASERAAVQTSRETSAARNEAVQRASNMSGGVTRENVEKAGGSWASGGRAKGGLMVRKK